MFTALTLLMRNILRVAETTVADEEMIGKCISLLGWQKSACLFLYKLAGPIMIDGSGRQLGWVILRGGLLCGAALRVRIILK